MGCYGSRKKNSHFTFASESNIINSSETLTINNRNIEIKKEENLHKYIFDDPGCVPLNNLENDIKNTYTGHFYHLYKINSPLNKNYPQYNLMMASQEAVSMPIFDSALDLIYNEKTNLETKEEDIVSKESKEEAKEESKEESKREKKEKKKEKEEKDKEDIDNREKKEFRTTEKATAKKKKDEEQMEYIQMMKNIKYFIDLYEKHPFDEAYFLADASVCFDVKFNCMDFIKDGFKLIFGTKNNFLLLSLKNQDTTTFELTQVRINNSAKLPGMIDQFGAKLICRAVNARSTLENAGGTEIDGINSFKLQSVTNTNETHYRETTQSFCNFDDSFLEDINEFKKVNRGAGEQFESNIVDRCVGIIDKDRDAYKDINKERKIRKPIDGHSAGEYKTNSSKSCVRFTCKESHTDNSLLVQIGESKIKEQTKTKTRTKECLKHNSFVEDLSPVLSDKYFFRTKYLQGSWAMGWLDFLETFIDNNDIHLQFYWQGPLYTC